jgi:hypothetical protein
MGFEVTRRLATRLAGIALLPHEAPNMVAQDRFSDRPRY